MARDYYKTLGVDENAKTDEIKHKYRTLAKKYHPDHNKGDKQAEEKFKEISEAYDVLKDDKKRQQYDTMRKFGGFDPRQGAGGFPGGGGGRFYTNGDFRQAFGGNFDMNDLSGLGGLGDIFSSLFGDNIRTRTRQRGYGTPPPNAPRKGRDIRITMKISVEQSATGVAKKIKMHLPESCSSCSATGYVSGGQRVCSRCSGTGQVTHTQGAFAISRPCPSCLGRGVEPGQMCQRCRGTGAVKKRKKLSVKIPPGIEHDGTVRLKGLGYPGKNNGPQGDLIIKVNIMDDQKFKREDSDIHTSVDISFPQAALGAKVAVQTLSKKVMLNVPAGTQPGSLLRLRGAGLSVGDKSGDLFVTVNVKVPTTLTDRQKELLQEFEELTGVGV
ncbi:MAG: molecular chaperone DnaJ [candidate division Zixibacteria bacterium]